MQKKIQNIKRFLFETIKQCTFLTIGAVVISVFAMFILEVFGIKTASFSEVVLAIAIFYSVVAFASSLIVLIIVIITDNKK